MSVFYIFKIDLYKVNIFLILHFFNIIRLNLTCFDKNIYIYLKAFFLCIYFLFI